MAITAETIDHIREMPTVVGRIVEEVLPIDDPTQAEPRIDSILEEENITSPPLLLLALNIEK